MRLAILLLTITLFPLTGIAATLEVPATYATIQSAIDAADDGDTILVAAGTYVENINFLGKDIVVMSSSGAADTVIDGNELGSVVTFGDEEPATAIIDGFTLTNGYAGEGGAVACFNDAQPIIRNCRIHDNEAINFGGGIDCFEASPQIRGCELFANVSWNGGAISLDHCSAVVANCRIYNNQALGFGGGGIYCLHGSLISNIQIVGCALYTNTGANGAGILCADASPDVANCVFYENEAEYYGGGFMVYSYAFPTIMNSIFRFNSAPEGSEISEFGTGHANVIYSNVHGGYTGLMNTAYNPRFVDEDNFDFHLESNSQMIDSGNDSAPSLAHVTRDIDGYSRFVDGKLNGLTVVDKGCHEFAYFMSDTGEFSMSTGGVVNIMIDTRADYTNEKYVILGGVTGTSPTNLPNNVKLYLTMDDVTNFLLTLVNTPLLPNWMGTLDGDGKASAQINSGPLPPGINPFTLYLAFTTYQPFTFSANAIEVEMVE